MLLIEWNFIFESFSVWVRAFFSTPITEAAVIGKPQSLFFETGLSVPNENAVMIGDDFQDDCLGAEACGITGLLVKTGKFREGDENQVKHSFESIVDAVNCIIEHNKRF